MRRFGPSLVLLPLLLAPACSDYDLHRPDKASDEPTDDTPPAGAPDIEVEPASFDFGSVLRNCPSAPQTLTIKNVGDDFLEVQELATDSPHYRIDWDGSPFQLGVDESATFEVTFTPEEYVLYEGALTITSNDPDEAEVTVPAVGNGDETALYEEGFTQEAWESLDVLWVVDNSGSMSEELDMVRENFDSFITEFVGLGLDYHLGVITTDMDNEGHKGALQGGYYITPDSSDPYTEFMNAVDQGSSGSGSERGMDAVKAALSEPLTSTTNAGFLRDDAALAAIVLSDEDDDSTIDESTFTSWFQGLKSDPAQVTFNAVVGDPSGPGLLDFGGCSGLVDGDMLQADAGDRYIDVVGRTGGIWRSICYEDYSETLAHVSLSSAGMVTTWTLSQTPTNSGQIEVYVDGTQWYYSLLDGWTYDADENSITFHGDALPGVGAYVLIRYPVAGECAG